MSANDLLGGAVRYLQTLDARAVQPSRKWLRLQTHISYYTSNRRVGENEVARTPRGSPDPFPQSSDPYDR